MILVSLESVVGLVFTVRWHEIFQSCFLLAKWQIRVCYRSECKNMTTLLILTVHMYIARSGILGLLYLQANSSGQFFLRPAAF